MPTTAGFIGLGSLALNLVKPQWFSPEEKKATATAMKLAVEGDLLARHGTDERPDAERRLADRVDDDRRDEQAGEDRRAVDRVDAERVPPQQAH